MCKTDDIEILAELSRLEWSAGAAILVSSFTADDVDRLVGEARRQGLCGWLLRRMIEEGVEGELKKRLKRVSMETIGRNSQIMATYRKIQETMRARGYEVVPMKGVYLIENLYGELWERPTSDIDLLVYGGDPLEAYREMVKIEGRGRKVDRTNILYQTMTPHYPPLHIGGCAVDVHYNLFGRDLTLNVEKIEVEKAEGALPSAGGRHEPTTSGGEGGYVLSEAQTMYHLVAHVVKNRDIEGNRLGWLVDIALLFDRIGKRRREVVERALAMNRKVESEMREVMAAAFWLLGEERRREAEEILGRETRKPGREMMAVRGKGRIAHISDIIRRLWKTAVLIIRYIAEENSEKTRIVRVKNVTLDLKDYLRGRLEHKKR